MEDPVQAFFVRSGLPPGATTRSLCWEFVKARYPHCRSSSSSSGGGGIAGETITESPSQGFCSFTFCVGSEVVVQFRPLCHGLDLGLAHTAGRIFGDLAPLTELLGTLRVPGGTGEDKHLLVYSLSRIPGQPLAELLLSTFTTGLSPICGNDDKPAALLTPPQSPTLTASSSQPSPPGQHVLVRDFARLYLSRAYAAAQSAPYTTDQQQQQQQQQPSSSSRSTFTLGLVGSSLQWRLERLCADLPPRFRPMAHRALAALPRVEALPWVLTHGDVVPGYVMVKMAPAGEEKQCEEEEEEEVQASSRLRLCLRGLLDWAEAEWLPFGIGLHAAEELFGRAVLPPPPSPPPAPPRHGSESAAGWDDAADAADAAAVAAAMSTTVDTCYPPRGSRFVYFSDAASLRRQFWDELEDAIPELANDGNMRDAVEAARLVGILLWHGIAWSDGNRDQVVQEGRDDEELQRLDLFLLGRKTTRLNRARR